MNSPVYYDSYRSKPWQFRKGPLSSPVLQDWLCREVMAIQETMAIQQGED